ncbi:hypothetical protein BDR05DRAFT_950310 [Suillus weaverae]|nr:hypothetical protein BDR05DRAFT_950310 [Suillus weaverae]
MFSLVSLGGCAFCSRQAADLSTDDAMLTYSSIAQGYLDLFCIISALLCMLFCYAPFALHKMPGFICLLVKNLSSVTSDNVDIENATFNGWLSEHFISSVLAFSAKGVIIAVITSSLIQPSHMEAMTYKATSMHHSNKVNVFMGQLLKLMEA